VLDVVRVEERISPPAAKETGDDANSSAERHVAQRTSRSWRTGILVASKRGHWIRNRVVDPVTEWLMRQEQILRDEERASFAAFVTLISIAVAVVGIFAAFIVRDRGEPTGLQMAILAGFPMAPLGLISILAPLGQAAAVRDEYLLRVERALHERLGKPVIGQERLPVPSFQHLTRPAWSTTPLAKALWAILYFAMAVVFGGVSCLALYEVRSLPVQIPLAVLYLMLWLVVGGSLARGVLNPGAAWTLAKTAAEDFAPRRIGPSAAD
jgi:hypothetical protein